MHTPPPANRSWFAAGVIVSLLLHALAALLLVGGFEGHRPTKAVVPVEVELVQLPPPPVEEQEPPAAELPEPPAEPVPEPEPAPEAQQEEQEEPEVKVLQPVVEFGDEDTAPESSEENAPEQGETGVDEPQAEEQSAEEPPAEDGDTPETESGAPEAEEPQADTSAVNEPQPDETDPEAQVEETETVETDAETKPEAASGAEDLGPEKPAPTDQEIADEQVELGPSEEVADVPAAEDPQEETGADDPEASGESAGEGETIVAAIPRTKPPAPPRSSRPTRPSPGGESSNSVAAQLRPTRRILTGDVLVDSRTRTAMRGMPPRQRLVHLCMTELRAQLQASTPPYFPDMMPSPRARGARTVLDTRGWVAFRSYGNWFNVAFRCEADRDVRRLSKFSYKVGGPIPRAQWGQRGLPIN